MLIPPKKKYVMFELFAFVVFCLLLPQSLTVSTHEPWSI